MRSAQAEKRGTFSQSPTRSLAAPPSLRSACSSISAEKSTPTRLFGSLDTKRASHRPVPHPRSTTSSPDIGGSNVPRNLSSRASKGFGWLSYTRDHSRYPSLGVTPRIGEKLDISRNVERVAYRLSSLGFRRLMN